MSESKINYVLNIFFNIKKIIIFNSNINVFSHSFI